LFCVENLNDEDRFEILRFATEVENLFGKMPEATRANRERATDFIQGLKPLGGTAINDAMRTALDTVRSRESGSDRLSAIIFLTDGRPTVGTTDEKGILDSLKKKLEEGKSRVFCFGIGTDVNTHLLDRITEEARGASQYVLPEEDLEVKLSSFFSKIKEPVLADPSLTFGGDIRVTKMYPTPLPDLFKGDQLVVVGRYEGKGDSAVTLEGKLNGTSRKLTYEVSFWIVIRKRFHSAALGHAPGGLFARRNPVAR
jgi:Ca-activated chloride channel family protein